jgi:hypothetical protein
MSTVARFVNEADEPLGDKPKFVKGDKKLMKLFISPQLELLLQKMYKSGDTFAKTVAHRILNIDQDPEENLFDISYVDIDRDKDDAVTFMPTQRAWFKMGFNDQEEANKKPTPDCEMWTAAGRQSLGVGKLINRLFDNFSDKAVDSFVKFFKAEIAATQIYDRFKLVRGEDIRFWYAETNYHKDPGGGKDAGLNNSCMRYASDGKNCQPYFDIYCKNNASEYPGLLNPDGTPHKFGYCSMLILTDHNNKLLGRALVWSNLRKPTDKTFMDRIYVFKQSDAELFKKYATDQGWLYKYDQQAFDASYLENGQRVNKSISLQLKPGEYKYYPFMDSLKYYNPTTGRLGSDPGNPVEGSKRLKLEGTGGQAGRVD